MILKFINDFLSEILQNSESSIFVFVRLYGFFDLFASVHNLFALFDTVCWVVSHAKALLLETTFCLL